MNLSLFYPFRGQGILIAIFQHIHAVVEGISRHLIIGRGGKVDVPLAPQVVYLRCPDQGAHLSFGVMLPGYEGLCLLQPCQGAGAANPDAVIGGHRGGKVMEDQYGLLKLLVINEGGALTWTGA